MHYAELHAKTNFSFLEGASHPEEIVTEAARLEYAAVAVTDVASFAGAVRAHQAAKDIGAKLILGTEIRPEDAPPVVLCWRPTARRTEISAASSPRAAAVPKRGNACCSSRTSRNMPRA